MYNKNTLFLIHPLFLLNRLKMRDFIAVTFALLSIFLIHEASSSYPVGDIRNCPTEQTVHPGSPLLRMDAMPGLGFDNLRNIELGQVYSKNYSSCQISNDGRYLLPDNINLIPVLKSEIDTSTEVFQHYNQYTSSSSYSINVEASASYGCAHAGLYRKKLLHFQLTMRFAMIMELVKKIH